LLLFPNVYGQQLLGLSNSNYSGIHGIYSNPAAIADSRFRFSFNLFSVDGNASNNYVRYKGPSSIFKALRNDEAFTEDYLEAVPTAKQKLFTSSVDFRGPAVMFTLGSRNSVAISSRVRGAFQMNNVSGNIADLIKTGGESDDLINQVNKNNEISLNGNMQAELGLSYAREIMNTGLHYIKGGVTVKKLTGIYSAHFINRDVTFRVEEQYNAADPEASDIVVNIDNIDLQYGYITEDPLQNIDAGKILGWLTKGDAPGYGWGGDIGFTYEYRPRMEKFHYSANGQDYIDRQQEKYKFRFSAALMDLGKIRYDNPGYIKSFDLKRTDKVLRLRDFEEAENTEDYTDIINESLDIRPADGKTAFQSGLPTALNLNADFNIKGRFYVNATWIQRLRGKYAVSMHQSSLLALTPRLDTKGFTLALPLSVYNNYSVFAVGGMVKVGPYFIGSDNIGGAFNIGSAYGANVYTGLSFSIGQAKQKDKKVKKKKGAPQVPAEAGSAPAAARMGN
jgi:hypothetical protein